MTTYTTEDPASPVHTLAARQLSDTPALNAAQASALDAIVDWAGSAPALDSDPFRVLKGYAGAGKTFMLRQLPDRMKGRIVWTAPTNKATKCLREALTADDYKPDCRTIYSLLGLRLEANGEVKELSQPEDPVDLSTYRLVVVDEAFMLNKAVMAAIQSGSTALIALVIALGLLAFFTLSALHATMQGVYSAALYRYATDHATPLPGFDANLLESAFSPKK